MFGKNRLGVYKSGSVNEEILKSVAETDRKGYTIIMYSEDNAERILHSNDCL
jgi:hypothetical protein